MLLNALWSGSCHPLNSVPSSCERFLAAFPFPCVLLRHQTQVAWDIRVSFADDLLGIDITLADVLCEEFDIDVPSGAIVLFLGEDRLAGFDWGMSIAAEILQALINPMLCEREVTLFDWAFRSLSEAWGFGPVDLDRSLQKARLRAVARVMGLPRDLPSSALANALRVIEADYVEAPTDLGLSMRLSAAGNLAEWRQELLASFAQAEACTRTMSGSV